MVYDLLGGPEKEKGPCLHLDNPRCKEKVSSGTGKEGKGPRSMAQKVDGGGGLDDGRVVVEVEEEVDVVVETSWGMMVKRYVIVPFVLFFALLPALSPALLLLLVGWGGELGARAEVEVGADVGVEGMGILGERCCCSSCRCRGWCCCCRRTGGLTSSRTILSMVFEWVRSVSVSVLDGPLFELMSCGGESVSVGGSGSSAPDIKGTVRLVFNIWLLLLLSPTTTASPLSSSSSTRLRLLRFERINLGRSAYSQTIGE